jgi:hypothetical protein
MSLRYRIKEVATVTDDVLERTINENVREGWALETIQFAMRDNSKRPSMAFVIFTREEPDEEKAGAGSEEGPG